MTEFDLALRGGTVVDGSGAPGFRADVGVKDGVITAVGHLDGGADQEIDAEGHVVSPGFVDGHTHMDAQVFWNPYGSSSCWHGVTSVVMGNCGFTLAPARADERALVVRNLERAEDIAPAALAAGIEWTWTDYPGYLDAVAAQPKAINYAGYVGHSALRTWAMGERAFEEEATEDDLAVMRTQLADALRAGALGLSTSRSDTHTTSDDRPVASRIASWAELRDLVGVVGKAGPNRFFQLSVEQNVSSLDAEVRKEALARIKQLTLESGVTTTFGIISPGDGYRWRGLIRLIDETNAAGGRMFGQSLPREATIILSFQSRLPYDRLPEWADLRARPLAEQRKLLDDPDVRSRLVSAAENGSYSSTIGAEVRPPDYDRIRVLLDPAGINPTLNEVARQRGVRPVEALIDLCRETDLDQFFTQAVGNPDEGEILAMLRHPEMIVTFSDSGAHVGYIMESSIQSYYLAYWVRKRQAFTLEEGVRMLTSRPCAAWGFDDRGLVRTGYAADLNVFDPERVGPGPLSVDHDLPNGEMRLKQGAIGFKATVVGGEIVLIDGDHTGRFPGQVLRRQ